MIDSDNLKTASLYINNQLLSRGLLHDGNSIDFADPALATDSESAATMGRIMSVVNDLILRRDRDAEHRESLSTTLRSLRAESLRQTNDLQRLGDKHTELQRKLNLADAAESSLRSQLKAAEATNHKLRDDAAKTRISVAQTRAACANEVRKRDRQIETLKKAVADAGRARGERKGSGITSITVTGDIGGESASGSGSTATEEEGYDLRMETNAFLAELARGLSEENEALLALVRRATARLREISGFPGPEEDGHVVTLTAGCDDLAADLDAIVDHLKTILTNPSFVPIEEVVVRDDEINRLRDGWEKMENRWQEAVHLIDGWRRRMISSGRSVNMEELKMGLRLSPVRVRNVEETAHALPQVQPLRLPTLEEDEEASRVMSPTPEGSLHLVPAPEYEEPDESDSEASSIFEDEVDMHELDVDEPNIQILEQSVMMHSVDSSPLPEPPRLSPLKELDSAANRGAHTGRGNAARDQGQFTTIIEENTRDLAQAEAPRPTSTRSNMPASSASKPAKPTVMAVSAQENTRPASAASQRSTTSHDSIQLVKTSQKQQSPISHSLTKPTAASSLKQRQAHEPSPRNARPVATAPTTKSASSAITTSSRGRAAAGRAAAAEQPNPSTTSKTMPTASSFSTSSTKDMPPPPLPTSTTTKEATTTTAPTPRSRSPVKPGPGSRLPLPRTAAPPQSPLTMATIAAKLAASEREADAARVRAKLKAARLGGKKRAPALNPAPSVAGSSTSTARTVSGCTDASSDAGGGVSIGSGSTNSDVDPVKRPLPAPSRDEEDELAPEASGTRQKAVPLPRKRERRASRTANRRRSTLNPWELESLITGGVAASPGRS